MNSNKETILIIDDNSLSIREITDHLHESGYATVIEESGLSGLKRAEILNPSLILLDVMMPETDGFQTCQLLKKNDLTKDIPVIFMTAFNSPEDTVKAFMSGGVDYITKTSYREEILARVGAHLKIRRQTKELEKARQSAEEANRAKSMFIANMSHEIRTPMNAILGFSEILFSKAKEPQEKNYLKTIHYSAQTLQTLINDILDLSKIEAGKIELQYEPVCFYELIHDIRELFDRQINEKGIALITQISPEIPEWIMLDHLRIRQVIINLVGNALKFTERGHIRVSVSGCCLDEPKTKCRLLIEVADTGIGIPKSRHHLIFEYFSQQYGQSQKKYGGTGLGLGISKRLVETMNGTISITGDVGKGSVFSVYFPELHTQLHPESAENEPCESESDIEFKPSAILIADEAESNRELIKGYLEDSPIRFIEADSVKKAVALLSELKRKMAGCLQEIDPPIIPDMILTDIRISDMNGAEAAKEIRNDFDSFNIPLVAMTASAMTDEIEIMKNIFDGYLIKPVSRRTLYQTLKKFLPCTVKNPNNILWNDDQGNIRETLEGLSCTIELLEKEFIPKWEEIHSIFFIDEIAEFSRQLQTLAKKHQIRALFDYSSELSEYVMSNKITEIEAVLSRFPDIVDQIKTKYLELIR